MDRGRGAYLDSLPNVGSTGEIQDKAVEIDPERPVLAVCLSSTSLNLCTNTLIPDLATSRSCNPVVTNNRKGRNCREPMRPLVQSLSLGC